MYVVGALLVKIQPSARVNYVKNNLKRVLK